MEKESEIFHAEDPDYSMMGVVEETIEKMSEEYEIKEAKGRFHPSSSPKYMKAESPDRKVQVGCRVLKDKELDEIDSEMTEAENPWELFVKYSPMELDEEEVNRYIQDVTP